MALKRIVGMLVLGFGTWTFVSLAQDSSIAHLLTHHSIHLDVNMVLINAVVTNSGGSQPVQGLDRNDFQLWEDRVEQKIETVSSEDVPVSVGIILDVSGSMKDKIGSAQRAAAMFLKSGTPEDEYFEILFADRPYLTSEFTTDIRRLQNSLLAMPAKGNTSLYDAVYLGINKLKESRHTKKALLLITDGEDNQSRYSFRNVREAIREQDIEIYAMGLLDPGTRAGSDALVQLSESSGGRAFFPFDLSDMSQACRIISDQLRNQYVIGYRSTNSAKDGAWRRIKLKVTASDNSPLQVHAKTGYYAPSGDPAGVTEKSPTSVGSTN